MTIAGPHEQDVPFADRDPVAVLFKPGQRNYRPRNSPMENMQLLPGFGRMEPAPAVHVRAGGLQNIDSPIPAVGTLEFYSGFGPASSGCKLKATGSLTIRTTDNCSPA
jgi:hypothetical protein